MGTEQGSAVQLGRWTHTRSLPRMWGRGQPGSVGRILLEEADIEHLRRNEIIQRKKNRKDVVGMGTGCTDAGKQK